LTTGKEMREGICARLHHCGADGFLAYPLQVRLFRASFESNETCLHSRRARIVSSSLGDYVSNGTGDYVAQSCGQKEQSGCQSRKSGQPLGPKLARNVTRKFPTNQCSFAKIGSRLYRVSHKETVAHNGELHRLRSAQRL
jgi:hypothetical protein